MTASLPVRRQRRSATPTAATGKGSRQVGLLPALAGAFALLVVAVAIGLSVGAAGLPLGTVWRAVANHIPFVPHPKVARVDDAIVWQIRAPRVVLAAIVGAMLAGGGATYQGVFRNPLADPYLLGVAAGGGLGATAIIVSGGSTDLLPIAAFAGAVIAVALTYALGSTARWDTGVGSPAATSG